MELAGLNWTIRGYNCCFMIQYISSVFQKHENPLLSL